jgi:hypothetical protein
MLFSQTNGVIPLCEVGATATGNVELDSFNMAGYDHAMVIVHFASTYITVSAATLTVETGSSDSGDLADATFHYRWNDTSAAGVASADVYGTDTTASSLSLGAAGTYAGHVLLLELDQDELPTASKTYQWVTVDLGTNASVGTIAAYAILSNPRYAKAVMPTALT